MVNTGKMINLKPCKTILTVVWIGLHFPNKNTESTLGKDALSTLFGIKSTSGLNVEQQVFPFYCHACATPCTLALVATQRLYFITS